MVNWLRHLISYENPLRRMWHKGRAMFAAYFFRFPARKMLVIGVTGTNGKTTTTHLIEHVLRQAGKRVAMISTVEFSINGRTHPNPSKKTTLSAFYTQRFLRECRRKKVDYVVLEASSHGLHQYRLWGIPFSVAVLTNITHEHLDYHETLEKYAEAKRMLFKSILPTCPPRLHNHLPPHRHTLVVNTATRFFDQFIQEPCEKKITYGLERGDLQAREIRENPQGGEEFLLRYERQQAKVHLIIGGEFNVENALGAAGAALACGLSIEEIKEGLESFSGVPGRLERILSPQGFEVVVDFALTPDALDRLYQVIRRKAKGHVIGIIGSCGERDRKKRPVMGQVVAEHTDLTIVTDEEPYSEDPLLIIQAVLAGAEKIKTLGKDLFVVEDRKEAIRFALKKARIKDTVVITGMGSFTSRNMNQGPIPWDEREIVRQLIKEMI